jgi:hypothetical protein
MISLGKYRFINILNIFNRKSLITKAFSTHKLNYGQGGNCEINLLNKNYNI